MSRYIGLVLCMTLILTGAIAVCNWLINPYLMFRSPIIHGVNELLTENYYKQLLFKPYQLRREQPRSIIIGASQAGVGFNPDFLPPPAFNLAVGGATMYLQYRLLQEAVLGNPELNTVVFETPFFAFNERDPNNQPGAEPSLENRLSIQANGKKNFTQPFYAAREILTSLLAWDVSRASLRTIAKQSDVSQMRRGSFIQKRNGQWIQQANPNSYTYLLIENSWKKSIFNDWLPAPEHIYQLPDANSGPFLYFRKSLQILYANNIKTTVVIAPMHASLFIALKETGLWTQYKDWKRTLVQINEEEAKNSGKEPFRIVDYAGVNAQSGESLPEHESTIPMKWFNDSMHPSPLYGDLVLQEILSDTVENGKILTGPGIEGKLEEDELQLQRYINLHPQVQAAIRTIIANAPTQDFKQAK